MRVIHWNISYSSKKEKIAEYLMDALKNGDTVACLQEVTEDAFSHILGTIGGGFDYVLFNRWCHWSSYATINQFKPWYLESYLTCK